MRITRSSDKALLREAWQRLPPEGKQRSRPRPAELSSPSSPSSSFGSQTSVAEKAKGAESFAEAAVRGLVEELGISQMEAAEVVRRASEEGGEGEERSEIKASAVSYPNLPCEYKSKLFVADIAGDLLPGEEFFEREEKTRRGTLVTRWQWVKVE